MRRMRRNFGGSESSGNSQSEAEELIERVDRERATFVKKYYNKNWPQRDLYHMMLNTKVGDEGVVRLILEEVAMLKEAPEIPQQKAG